MTEEFGEPLPRTVLAASAKGAQVRTALLTQSTSWLQDSPSGSCSCCPSRRLCGGTSVSCNNTS